MSLTGGGRPRWVAAADRRPQAPPDSRYRLVARLHGNAGRPPGKFLAAVGAPVADLGLLGQLTEGHEDHVLARSGR
jgi:hypothetical protein